MAKKAIIFGINGQDGSYLAELLLSKKYKVYGVVRRCSVNNLGRIQHLLDNKNLKLIEGDVTDPVFTYSNIKEIQADEIYNLAAQSHVGESFNQPAYTIEVDLKGVLYILDAIVKYSKSSRFYQASTSEMYGSCFSYIDKAGDRLESKTAIGREDFLKLNAFQDEHTYFVPNSPYAVAKYGSHNLVNIYRTAHKIFACSGILFNHESPRRGELFVTRKITKTLSEIKNRKRKGPLELGNLDAKRDWGHAKDYVRSMWLMLQNDYPDDYVVSMEEQHSVRDFVNVACNYIGFDIEWSGEGKDEVAIDKNTGKVLVQINPDYYRPAEVESLVGDCTKAKGVLGWKPEYTFEKLVEEMCECDLRATR